MSMLRRRSRQKKYLKHLSDNRRSACEFCLLGKSDPQFMAATPHFKVIRNIFGYDVWDSCGISDQIMLVPKRHIVGVAELRPAEKTDYINQLIKYEKQGYSIYARAPSAITKSVIHQHTHFIKLDNKRKKALLYLKKPHVLLAR